MAISLWGSSITSVMGAQNVEIAAVAGGGFSVFATTGSRFDFDMANGIWRLIAPKAMLYNFGNVSEQLSTVDLLDNETTTGVTPDLHSLDVIRQGNTFLVVSTEGFFNSQTLTDGSTDVHFQSFDTSGRSLDSAAVLSASPLSNSDSGPLHLDLDPLVGGGWIVTWYEVFGADERAFRAVLNGDGIFVSAASEFSTLFNVDPYGFSRSGTSASVLSDGRVLLVWPQYDFYVGSRTLQGGFLSSDGLTAISAPFEISASLPYSEIPGQAVELASGKVLVLWQGSGDVRARVMTSAGTADGAEFTVNATTAGTQTFSDVVALPSGQVLATWTSTDGTDRRIVAQLLDANGALDGGEFAIAQTTVSGAIGMGYVIKSVESLGDGRVAVAYVAPNSSTHVQVIDTRPSTTLTGTSGDDVLIGAATGGVINGLDGNDTLYGFEGNDSLNGGAGNDRLLGHTGADTMTGDTGDDTYYVDRLEDVVVETLNAGTDTIVSTIALPLAEHVENLLLRGVAALSGTGNDLANTLTGNDGDNLLDGGAGNDVIIGGAGNDVLEGGTGADRFDGGAGNDTAYVRDASDRVLAAVGGGTDTVVSSLNYRLLASSEIEIFNAADGTAALTLEGNGYAQTMTGNAGHNRLKGLVGNDALIGGDGNDQLYGGNGVDTLTGGAGLDSYVFDFAPNRLSNADVVTDFNVADDRFLLDDAAFVGLGTIGGLGAARFRLGTAAADLDDRIIYNAATGQVFFDANGSVAGGQILFATVSASTALTSADFVIY